jgi:hypothetical protein
MTKGNTDTTKHAWVVNGFGTSKCDKRGLLERAAAWEKTWQY